MSVGKFWSKVIFLNLKLLFVYFSSFRGRSSTENLSSAAAQQTRSRYLHAGDALHSECLYCALTLLLQDHIIRISLDYNVEGEEKKEDSKDQGENMGKGNEELMG